MGRTALVVLVPEADVAIGRDLRLAVGRDGGPVPGLPVALAPVLPITTFVSELTLLVEDDADRWGIGHRWPLG